ncbi:plasmid stabilization protein [Delftia sp.]|uniref:FitA-like ribbon-helix-helix domain-containing protein n=1 Tax=Delftia sp. TaxID=1886637 RepID=UPI00259D03A6|nr:plasmid stabilization protein [Delftia sp.]
MTTMTIHDLDEDLQARCSQADLHGHSMEEEARNILRAALAANAAEGHSLFDSIRARRAPGRR